MNYNHHDEQMQRNGAYARDHYRAELETLLREIRYLSEQGMAVDGVQHKQHFLAQIAIRVGIPAERIEDRGVAP